MAVGLHAPGHPRQRRRRTVSGSAGRCRGEIGEASLMRTLEEGRRRKAAREPHGDLVPRYGRSVERPRRRLKLRFCASHGGGLHCRRAQGDRWTNARNNAPCLSSREGKSGESMHGTKVKRRLGRKKSYWWPLLVAGCPTFEVASDGHVRDFDCGSRFSVRDVIDHDCVVIM